MKNKNEIKKLKKCFINLQDIVVVIDKIGSGFEGREETALALLLYFKKKKTLDVLAKTLRLIYELLENNLSEKELDDFIEQESNLWKPPYGASKEELLKMLED